MHRKYFIYGCVLLLFSMIGCTTEPYDVYPVNTLLSNSTLLNSLAESDSSGVFYSLPKTVFRLSFTVKKTDKTMGEYKEYLDEIDEAYKEAVKNDKEEKSDKLKKIVQLINATNAISNNTTEYEVTEVSITPEAEPDYGQQYFVKISDKSYIANSLNMALSEYGIITDTSVSSSDKRLDYAVTALETTASIFGKVIGLGSPDNSIAESKASWSDRAINDYNTYTDLVASYKDIVELANPDYVYINKDVYSSVKEDLTSKINLLKSKFIGSQKPESKTFTARLCPAGNTLLNPSNTTVFSYSAKGLLYPDSNSVLSFDQQVFLPAPPKKDAAEKKSAAEQQLPEQTDVVLKIENPFDGSTEGLSKISKVLSALAGNTGDSAAGDSFCTSPPCGLAYRIPGKVRVSIYDGDKLLKVNEMLLAQKGVVAFLPHELDSSESEINTTFYGDSGAVKSVKLSNTPTDSSVITSAGNAVTTALSPYDEATQLELKVAREQAKASIATAKYNEEYYKKQLDDLENSASAGSEE